MRLIIIVLIIITIIINNNVNINQTCGLFIRSVVTTYNIIKIVLY